MNMEEKLSRRKMESSRSRPDTMNEMSARQVGESMARSSLASHLEINGDVEGSSSKTETM